MRGCRTGEERGQVGTGLPDQCRTCGPCAPLWSCSCPLGCPQPFCALPHVSQAETNMMCLAPPSSRCPCHQLLCSRHTVPSPCPASCISTRFQTLQAAFLAPSRSSASPISLDFAHGRDWLCIAACCSSGIRDHVLVTSVPLVPGILSEKRGGYTMRVGRVHFVSPRGPGAHGFLLACPCFLCVEF